MSDIVNRENRKALPKFLLILLASAIFGGILGFGAGWLGGSSASDSVRDTANYIIGYILPWLIPAGSLVLLADAFRRYRRAKRRFAQWDGEDEAAMEAAEEDLNWSMLLGTEAMVANLFLLSVSPYAAVPGGALTVAGVFILAVAVIVILQQKIVDLTRRMNPEKQGSVYELKFHKKWLASCDEAEQRQIGQAAYRAYWISSRVCMFLWVILLLLDFVFGFGPLPAFAVLLVWGVQQGTYCWECIRMGKGGAFQ